MAPRRVFGEATRLATTEHRYRTVSTRDSNWQPGNIQASFSRSARMYDRAAKSGDIVAVPFGRYLLLERIKRGGMAEVYRAKVVAAEGFEKIVAIKRILPHLAANEDFVSMFIDEAKIVSLLNHQNICPVIELGKCDDGLYIVMEYIWGRDLRQILNALGRSGRLMPVTVAAYVAGRIAEGLDYAHRRVGPKGVPLDIVHRDVSPQNILISFDGEVKIIDFGIARASQRSTQTRVGTFKGKFAYMSPEHARGKETDRRSDLFAVGILLHEMITGQRLFAAKTDLDTLDRVRNCVVPPPTRPFEDVPGELSDIVLKSLQREPEDRYQWAGEMHEALHHFLMKSGELSTASRLSNWMCLNFSEQAAKSLTDQDRATRAKPPGEPEEPAESVEVSVELPKEEYISLRSSDGGPVDPSNVGFAASERPTSPANKAKAANPDMDAEVEAKSFSVDIDNGGDSAVEPSGSYTGDLIGEESSSAEQSYSGGEIVAMPPVLANQSSTEDSVTGTGAVQIEYTPYESEPQAQPEDSDSVVIDCEASGGIQISSSCDDGENFMILDSVPPPPAAGVPTIPAVHPKKPAPEEPVAEPLPLELADEPEAKAPTLKVLDETGAESSLEIITDDEEELELEILDDADEEELEILDDADEEAEASVVEEDEGEEADTLWGSAFSNEPDPIDKA